LRPRREIVFAGVSELVARSGRIDPSAHEPACARRRRGTGARPSQATKSDLSNAGLRCVALTTVEPLRMPSTQQKVFQVFLRLIRVEEKRVVEYG
jgi:hypothetical protein